MRNLTPRFVRLVLIPASCLVFLVGMLASAAVFYSGKSFDPKLAVLSDMQSPDENPHGFAASAVGTGLSAALLGGAAIVFFGRLRNDSPMLALAGLAMFTVGAISGIAVAILAPFTHGYTPMHVQLASAAFVGIITGTWLHLLAARAAPALLAFQLGAILLVGYLCYGPVEFHNDRLITSLAFWEWVLCVNCGFALWTLARAVEARALLTAVPQHPSEGKGI